MMNPLAILSGVPSRGKVWCSAGITLLCLGNVHAGTFEAWQYQQDIDVTDPGLTQVSLPAETLNAARTGLEDLRLVDAQGGEVPYLLDQARPTPPPVFPAGTFRSTLEGASTVVLIDTGSNVPVMGVLLQTPALQFIKAVQVEGSTDGQHWEKLADGVPIFRQARGASGLEVRFDKGAWSKLRLTVDDRRSDPVPFTGVKLRAAAQASPPPESVEVTIAARDEGPDESRLTLDLGAANLTLASITVDTDEPLFSRNVTLATPQISEDGVHEQTLASGTILRFDGNGQPVVSQQTLTLDCQAPSRELVLRIHNEDSPPLSIKGIRARRRPVNLIFYARETGVYRLFLGNPLCERPRYDIVALSSQLRAQSEQVVKAGIRALSDNLEYQVPEALAGLSFVGAPLDISPWQYRKRIRIDGTGVQTLELDLEALARSQSDFRDLRIMGDGRQVPFLVEHTSITRSIDPLVTQTADPKRPAVSRWSLKLPFANLPLHQLVCASSSPLFERKARLFEEVLDTRGSRFPRELGSAFWARTPDRRSRLLELALSQPPRTDTLSLETDNGDNPSIRLQEFRLFYPVTRLVFKGAAGDALTLYYGNPSVRAPNYDLRLVGHQLLAAPKVAASLGEQEQLKSSSWTQGQSLTGVRGIIFWGVLALVVVALLIILARLLPKSSSTGPEP